MNLKYIFEHTFSNPGDKHRTIPIFICTAQFHFVLLHNLGPLAKNVYQQLVALLTKG